MSKRFLKICSMILVLVMMFQMLPHQALADMIYTEDTDLSGNLSADSSLDTSKLEVVSEVIEKRSEFSKEFLMNNGLHMAAVYGSAVHYEEDGQWKEIDNTLVATVSGDDSVYTNTAGVWNISFPQQLSSNKYISITKDGYTLRFAMAGVLSGSGHEVMGGDVSLMGIGEQIDSGTLSVQEAQTATAQVQQADLTAMYEGAEHPETVVEKAASRLQYSSVYNNTNVVYDLHSNQLKESIVIGQYDSSVRGYRYTLDVGNLVPVLNDDNSIWLYDSEQENVVMAMPAPFLMDAENAYNGDVEVALQGSGSSYTLIYLLPQEWLAAEDRAWPVVLDPVISADIDVDNIRDVGVAENYVFSYTHGVFSCGYSSGWGARRCFVKYDKIPELSSSDVIVHATMRLERHGNYQYTKIATVEVHKVLENWDSEGMTWSNMPDTESTIEDFANVQGLGYYYWDVTEIVRSWYIGQNYGMMFKASDAVEAGGSDNYKEFYASDYSPYHRPTLAIYFRNNNGLESYWDYTASSAGRAGTGYINKYTGNLVWVRSDMGFGGNRMPVSISHIYNANDRDNNDFNVGFGWRTNFNQLVYEWSVDDDYFVWEDSDGTHHYFRWVSYGKYEDEDGLELTLTTKGSGERTYTITDKQGNASYFDAKGRLTYQENNQATKSNIVIDYVDSTTNRIDTVTDGAGRVYDYVYDDTTGMLSEILYMGSDSIERTFVTYTYDSDFRLTAITDKDTKSVSYTYDNTNLLSTATDIDGYTLAYTYNTVEDGQPSRVETVSESHNSVLGGQLTITYAQNQTTFMDSEENTQIVQFNDWGNTLCIQDGEGRAQYARYASNHPSESGKGNQLTVASKLQNTVGNRLKNTSFESDSLWTVTNSTIITCASDAESAYLGSKSMKMTHSTSTTKAGVKSETFTVGSGETYTFSAYVKTGASTAFLAIGTSTSTTDISETIPANQDWTRVQVSYTNTSTVAKTVSAYVLSSGAGDTWVDCVQVEKSPTASRYNLIQNGDFSFATDWGFGTDYTIPTATNNAAPQLSSSVYTATGNPKGNNRISQDVTVSGNAGDTFVLAGWAMGDAIPLTNLNDDNIREFGLIAQFHYTDDTYSPIFGSEDTDAIKEAKKESFKIHFNTAVENWQYIAAPIVAEKDYDYITIIVAYDYGANQVSFDGIQLFKEEFGNSYTYDDDGNVVSVVDLQKQNTTYEYDEDGNLTEILQDNKAKMTYTYDSNHNVLTATSGEGLRYKFTYDTYGNNTSVSIVKMVKNEETDEWEEVANSPSITSSAMYFSDSENPNDPATGNYLVSTTDAAGKVTTYEYDPQTNVLKSVKYPNDSDTTKTTYTYDSMYRMTTASAMAGTENLTAAYTYENDLLTKITTGSTTYNFGYGNFGLRTDIKIGELSETNSGITLATYDYTERTNYLKTLAYGNGDVVEYEYDQQGRVTMQEYEDGDTVTYQYDNNGALATMTDSATGRKTTYYYDFTDRLMKYVESGTGYYHSVGYEYDTLNNLTTLVETINGVDRTTSYEYDDDNRVIGITTGNASKTYSYDAWGRVLSRTTKHNGTDIFTDTLSYREVSGKATGQVESLATKVGTFEYTYDDNGNITSVTFGGKTTTYSYDSQNQLIREDNEAAGKTWTWSYNNAGNFIVREEYPYTTSNIYSDNIIDAYYYGYGNSQWGDLLTRANGQDVTYDAIGNPLYDGTWTYTWEHGRQLASMSNGTTTWSYTYDANGMRTKRTNGTTTYSYVYNGSQLVQMVYVYNSTATTFNFYYDASGAPLSVNINGTDYFYVTNLQGDIVAILNASGTKVVSYEYDAWGKLTDSEIIPASATDVYLAFNPLRYRGYVFDLDTGLYYLQSRYYNPEVGRFLNADAFPSTGQGLTGNNMFAYCGNNPISRADTQGTLWHVAFGAILGGVISGVSKAWECIKDGDSIEEIIKQTLVSTACGAVGGALAATGIGVGGQVIIGAALGAVESAANQMIDDGEVNMGRVFLDTCAGAIGGLAGGNGASFGSKFMDYHRKQFAKNIGLDGIGTALTKLVKHTAKWAQSNLAVDTTLGVLKATFGNKAMGAVIDGFELLAQA